MQIFSSQIVRYGDENDQQERIGQFGVRVPDFFILSFIFWSNKYGGIKKNIRGKEEKTVK